MTDYGIIIRNNRKVIIIDGQYKNYTLYQSGIANLSILTNLISIPNTNDSLITLFKPPTDEYVNPYGINDTTSGHSDILFASSGDSTCNYMIYKDGQSTAISEYGLLVYDSSGSVVFNSNETGYLKPIFRYTYTPPTLGNTANVTVKNADKNYFVIMGGALAYAINSGYLNRYLLGLKKIDSTTLQMNYVPIYAESNGGSGGGYSLYWPQYIYEFEPPPGL